MVFPGLDYRRTWLLAFQYVMQQYFYVFICKSGLNLNEKYFTFKITGFNPSHILFSMIWYDKWI